MTEVERAPVAPRWISMRRACEILGVNPATLRQWTDEGKVSAYVTPGGHRRYDEGVLLTLVRPRTRPADAAQPPFLVGHGDYEATMRQRLEAAPWFRTFDAAARQQLRILGNSMLYLLSAFLASEDERERATCLERAREVASNHGAVAAGSGLSLMDATQAFLVFRAPVVDRLVDWSRGGPAEQDRLADVLHRANEFMDAALLAMLAAFSAHADRREALP
jgi:hypothetical protein